MFENSTVVAMKIFTTFQKASEKLGIYRPQSFQLFQTLNIKNFGILICFVFFSLATILYLISEAKTFDEYSESLLGFVVGISIVGCFIVIIWKTADIYRLIDNFERVITQSEWFLRSDCKNTKCNEIKIFRNGKIGIIKTVVWKCKCKSRKMVGGVGCIYGTNFDTSCIGRFYFGNFVDSSNERFATKRL